MPCKNPNCNYCELCACEHQADEHMAGNGHCFKCGDENCSHFRALTLDEKWQKLKLLYPAEYSYNEFITRYSKLN